MGPPVRDLLAWTECLCGLFREDQMSYKDLPSLSLSFLVRKMGIITVFVTTIRNLMQASHLARVQHTVNPPSTVGSL